MKAKKAVKRIEKVESILKAVIEEFSEIDPGQRQLLDSAMGLATQARTEIVRPRAKQAPKNSKTTPTEALRKGPGKSVSKKEPLAEVG